MIQVYYIEDLTIDMIDNLVEKGVVFDVASKTSLLPKNTSHNERDTVRSSRNKRIEDLQ